MKRGRVDRVVFPPQQVAEVKVIACELPINSDAELAAVNLTRDKFHGEWNYTIKPQGR